MKVGFLVGDIANISGGSNVVVEHAAGLSALGHEVVLITSGAPPVHATWHPRIAALDLRSLAEAATLEFDFVFATWWLTYFDLFRLNSRVYGYLNQSLESRFHSERHHKLLNRVTYSLPLLFVTEAKWLAQFIGQVRPDAQCLYVKNGLSEEFFPRARAVPERSGPLRVLVEGPWGVAFKAVPETFQLLEQAGDQCEFAVGWLTSDSRGAHPRVGGQPVRVHEKLPIDEVRHVLRQYDVLIKLSRVEGMFGPPLEMFSQGGTAITTSVSGSDEFMVHGLNGFLVEPHNQGQVVPYLKLLSESPELLARLKANALHTAQQWPAWPAATRELAGHLERLAAIGYTNSYLRPALAGLSTLRGHWLDDVGTSQPSNGPYIGPGEWALMTQYRKLKGSKPASIVKQLVPSAIKRGVRAYFTRAFE